MKIPELKIPKVKIPGLDIGKPDVEKYLSGVHFPASKQELVDAATNNSAPEPVVNSMAKMPDQMYNSVDEVIQTMSGK
jgi:hypothetical protein